MSLLNVYTERPSNPALMRSHRFLLLLLVVPLLMTGCDALFGSKNDETTEEIFVAGRTPPGLISEAEYVALFPFYTQGGDGSPLQAPRDVYVGYDEFIYVVDDRGLHMLDLAGRPALFIPLTHATSVIQDRTLNLYVGARRDTTLNGVTWNLPVIYKYAGLTTNTPRVENIIWHPFDDDSRKFSRPDPIPTDEEVEFTGVAILYNNDIYVSRRGPVNDPTSVILPHNTILRFTPEGMNTQALIALHPARPSLRSAINPTNVLTFIHPPQRPNFTPSLDFLIAQSAFPDGQAPENAGPTDGLRFSVLSILAVETSDGFEFRTDTQKLQAAASPERGDGFLYEEFKFLNPVDLGFAADGTNYIYVLDAGKDSLFVFTANGIEGVAAPPGAQSTLPVVVSFGGTGDGALQFRDPQGVAYFDQIVYVADTGNNRLSRFRLNTDFE